MHSFPAEAYKAQTPEEYAAWLARRAKPLPRPEQVQEPDTLLGFLLRGVLLIAVCLGVGWLGVNTPISPRGPPQVILHEASLGYSASLDSRDAVLIAHDLLSSSEADLIRMHEGDVCETTGPWGA